MLNYMKTINEKYLEIIKKCRFVSKPNEWFIEGTEVKLDNTCTFPDYNDDDKFNSIAGLFYEMTMETFEGYSGELPREDGETCPFNEFFIYDEFGNEISELTLEEYEVLLDSKKK